MLFFNGWSVNPHRVNFHCFIRLVVGLVQPGNCGAKVPTKICVQSLIWLFRNRIFLYWRFFSLGCFNDKFILRRCLRKGSMVFLLVIVVASPKNCCRMTKIKQFLFWCLSCRTLCRIDISMKHYLLAPPARQLLDLM